MTAPYQDPTVAEHDAINRTYTPEEVQGLVRLLLADRRRFSEYEATIRTLHARVHELEDEMSSGVEISEAAEREAREHLEAAA